MTYLHFWLRTGIAFGALLLAIWAGARLSDAAQAHALQTSAAPVDAHLGKGYEALKEERYEEAAVEFRAALEIDPKLALRARFPLAIALFEMHQNTEAREELQTVRRETGDHPNISYYLGRLDLEDHYFESAIRNLTAAMANPPYPDTAYHLGFAYFKHGDYKEAEEWLKKAEKRTPHDSRVPYQLGTLYRTEGRAEEAKEAFARSDAVRERNDKESGIKRECIQDLDQGLKEKAAAVCDQLYDPNDADKLTALGILYGQHGEADRALKPLLRAVELEPQSPQMQYNLALTYVQLGQLEEARAHLAEAVKRWPDLFPLNALYGVVLWDLGQTLPAYEALVRAHQLNAGDTKTAEVLYRCELALAQDSEKSKKDSEAIRYLEEAAKLMPNEAEPHARLAVIYTRTGREEKAKNEQREANRLTKPAQ